MLRLAIVFRVFSEGYHASEKRLGFCRSPEEVQQQLSLLLQMEFDTEAGHEELRGGKTLCNVGVGLT